MTLEIVSPKYGTLYVLIDDEYKELISQYRMHVSKSTNTFYVNCRKIGDKTRRKILLHHIVTSYKFVDHINGNGLDNRSCNLRESSPSQNNKNATKRKDSKWSNYKGVKYDVNSKKWIARIQYDHKRITIGRFNTEIEAAEAYNRKSLELHGEHGKRNEIT